MIEIIVIVVGGVFTAITLGTLGFASLLDKRDRAERDAANALISFVRVENGTPCPKCGVATTLKGGLQGLSPPRRCDERDCAVRADHLHLMCFTCGRTLAMRPHDAQLEENAP